MLKIYKDNVRNELFKVDGEVIEKLLQPVLN